MDTKNESCLTDFRVGDFTVNGNSSTLTRPDGTIVSLERVLFLTLTVLAQTPGQFIKNEELLEKVYAGKIVSTNVIQQNIKRLRLAFQDKDHQIIENKQRVGYRLNLSVFPIKNRVDAKERPINEEYRFRHKRLFILVPFCVILISSVLVSFNSADLIKIDSSIPLSYLEGQAYFPSVSSDYNYLVFSHRENRDDHWSIAMRTIRNEEEVVLLKSNQEDYKHPQISSDLRSVIFTKITDNACDFMLGYFDSKREALTSYEKIYSCNASSKGAKIIEGPEGTGNYIISESDSIDNPYSLYLINPYLRKKERITSPTRKWSR